MANVVNTNTLLTGDRQVVVRWDGILDTGNESAVKKFDVSGFTRSDGVAATHATIMKIDYIVAGFSSVTILFDATNDDEAVVLTPNSGSIDYTEFGGMKNPKSAGYTGDLMLTTAGTPAATCVYDILLHLKLHYN